MKLFCKSVKIPFKKLMIKWPSLEKSFNPLDWNDYTALESCDFWHKDAIKSTHFIPSERLYGLDSQGDFSFIEVNEVDRNRVKEIYTYYMQFYNKLYEYRVS